MAINYAHLGNGITVWDTEKVKGTDYEIVAHISPMRNIILYSNLSNEHIKQVIDIALISHISVSHSQTENVYIVNIHSKTSISIKHYYASANKNNCPITYFYINRDSYLPVVIPKKEVIKKKIRKSPTPKPNKIGNPLKSFDDLDRLVQNKQCVVISGRLFAAAVIYCWQYCIVKSYIERGIMFEYLKS